MTRRPIGVKTILTALAAVLALSLQACGDEEPTPTATDDEAGLSLDDLDGRVFASVRVEGRQLVDGTRVRLAFEGTDVSADAGCNHLFGTAAADGDTLSVTDMGSTEMGCPDGRNDQDAWLTTFLGAGTTAALSEGMLTLTGGGVTLELEEQDGPEEDRPDQDGEDPDQPTSDDGAVVGN
ncbi:META domain-containing protein [Nocardioides silvaticus]|uniref:META domain-containing protein n=1 Tax=Nocardioides silvaticus TaxID=2201891 RepID=UPI001304DF16|nr:META domain-containing protein [Nocardioides silvaticus]